MMFLLLILCLSVFSNFVQSMCPVSIITILKNSSMAFLGKKSNLPNDAYRISLMKPTYYTFYSIT